MANGVSADPIRGVSPGATSTIEQTANSCPTFSWERADDAVGYDLVVFTTHLKLDTDTGLIQDFELSDEVLLETLPGGASSWTPQPGAVSRTRC